MISRAHQAAALQIPAANVGSFVCAISAGVSVPVLLTSYPPTRDSPDLYHNVKLWEAGRATSAASTFFEPITIGPQDQTFVDGGTGANNPIQRLWNEAKDVFCDGSSTRMNKNLRTLVSIGTGVPDLKAFGDDVASLGKSLISIATETEETADMFLQDHSDLDEEGRYYRFNVPRGLASIGMEDAAEAPHVKDYTDAYLRPQHTYKALRMCAKSLGGPIVAESEAIGQSV